MKGVVTAERQRCKDVILSQLFFTTLPCPPRSIRFSLNSNVWKFQGYGFWCQPHPVRILSSGLAHYLLEGKNSIREYDLELEASREGTEDKRGRLSHRAENVHIHTRFNIVRNKFHVWLAFYCDFKLWVRVKKCYTHKKNCQWGYQVYS